MKVVVCASVAGTVMLGVYPKPFIEWAVASTEIFSHLVGL